MATRTTKQRPAAKQPGKTTEPFSIDSPEYVEWGHADDLVTAAELYHQYSEDPEFLAAIANTKALDDLRRKERRLDRVVKKKIRASLKLKAAGGAA